MKPIGSDEKDSSRKIGRREFLKKVGTSAVALSFAGSFSSTAESKEKQKLVLVGHRVHQAAASGEDVKGKNLIKLFEQKYDAEVTYFTYPNSEVHEKLFRVGPLNRTEEDIFHVLEGWAIPILTKFMVPLNPYMEKKPIEGWPADWPKAMVEMGTLMGKTYLIPVRAGVSCMWYNRKLLKERGLDSPPKTSEEIYDVAKACTFTRSSGEKVYGWCIRGSKGFVYSIILVIARMFGGDDTYLITPDFRIMLTEPPILQSLEFLQKLFRDHLCPADMYTYEYAEVIKMFQEGRVAMVLEPSNYWHTFNDAKSSKIAGDAIPIPTPTSKKLMHIRPYSNSVSYFWSQGILQGSQRKDLAWEYIRYLAARDSHLEMAKNGNQPPRLSVLADREYIKTDPGADVTKKLLAVAKVALPAFPNVSQVVDIIGEHCQNVMVQGKAPMDEMKKATEEIKPLLPS